MAKSDVVFSIWSPRYYKSVWCVRGGNQRDGARVALDNGCIISLVRWAHSHDIVSKRWHVGRSDRGASPLPLHHLFGALTTAPKTWHAGRASGSGRVISLVRCAEDRCRAEAHEAANKNIPIVRLKR